MKLNEKRIVEVVLIILFPAALFAGCAGNGNEKPEIVNEAMANNTQAYESQVNEAQDNLIVYSGDQPSEDEAVSLTATTTAITLTPVENEQGAVLESSVYFKTNQYTVQIEDEALLAHYASKLLSDPSGSLVINGHADERGSTDYNLTLSDQRAQEVEARLLSLGVPNGQLRTHGYGETMPAVSLSDWQENRRVDLEYTNAIVSNSNTQENPKERQSQLAGEMMAEQMISEIQ